MTHSIPSLMSMIETLVSTPSVSSAREDLDQGNRAVIDHLAFWLEDTGFTVEIMPLPDRPGKANLIATLGHGPGGLVLSGHSDTVPCNESQWNYDPFRLTQTDTRLYGLGTADMKAFLALAIDALHDIRPEDLEEPVILLATADEETSMSGAKALVAQESLHARHALIGEPTDMRPVRMHKGMLMEAIYLQGRAGHSSDPAHGCSALEAMHQVISALLTWRTRLQQKHHNPLFSVPVPTLNLGHIHGGDNPNRICAECELHLDLRPLPGMDLEDLRTQIRNCVTSVLHDTEISVRFESLFDGIPAMVTRADSDIVRIAERLTGHASEAVAFGTEAPYLQQLGMHTVVLGPGNIEQAHQADEYLALDRLEPTTTLLRKLVKSVCTRGKRLL